MAEKTNISWTEATVNFWRGCKKVSSGCDNCYMFRDQLRYGNDPTVVTRCGKHNVAFFFKQHSGLRPGENTLLNGEVYQEHPDYSR
jgi:protein gp37